MVAPDAVKFGEVHADTAYGWIGPHRSRVDSG